MDVIQESDAELSMLRQMAAGDKSAFERLYRRYYDSMFWFARQMLGSADAAEDVVEDVFVMVWSSRSAMTNISNFKAFAYSSVRNACLNVLKSSFVAKRDSMAEGDLLVRPAESDPLDGMLRKELLEAIQGAINGLPPRCRIIFKMAKEDGMAHRDIATALGVTVSTVERQLLLAKDKIRRAIEPLTEKKGKNCFRL